MAQPTIEELFGIGVSYDQNNQGLFFPSNIFSAYGVDVNSAPAIELLAVIIISSHLALKDNTDETVNVTATLNTSSPSIRNNEEKTSFNYQLEFFGTYTAPTFSPSEL